MNYELINVKFLKFHVFIIIIGNILAIYLLNF